MSRSPAATRRSTSGTAAAPAPGRYTENPSDGPEWRNWQTQETQNLPPVTRRVGSIPSSGTNPYDEPTPSMGIYRFLLAALVVLFHFGGLSWIVGRVAVYAFYCISANARVRALVTHPGVEDTARIDVQRFETAQ